MIKKDQVTHQSGNRTGAAARMSRSRVVAGGTCGRMTGAKTPHTPAPRPCLASYRPK